MRKSNFLYLLILTGVILFGCSSEEDPTDGGGWMIPSGYSDEEVGAIFAENCAESGCHGAGNPENGLNMSDFTTLMKGSDSRSYAGTDNGGGAVVIPYHPEKSLLYRMISGQTVPSMPYNRPMLSSGEIETVRKWIEEGAKNVDNMVPPIDAGYRIFVCSQGADFVNVLDSKSKNIVRVVKTDFMAENDAPHMVKYHNGYIYVTTIKSGKFLKYDTSDYSLVGEVNGLEYPGMIIITSDGKRAFVSRSTSAPGAYSTIYHINLETMSMINEITLPVEGIPHAIDLTSDGRTLYVANLTKNRLSIVDAESGEFQEDILLSEDTDHQPMQAALSPDDKYLYISARGSGKLLVFDTQAKEIVSEVEVGGGPMHIAVNSTGSKIYVPTMMNGKVNIVSYSGNDWAKTGEISHPAFKMPHGCEISPDDKYLYISCRNTDGAYASPYPDPDNTMPGIIGIINLENNSVEKFSETGAYGAGVAVEN